MRKILYIFLLCSPSAFCQAPMKIWDKTIGGTLRDKARSMIQTSDGSFVIAGESLSNISGDKSEASKGNTDYWVVKLNSSGQKVWDKTYGGSFDDICRSIIPTSDGGFILVGSSISGISGDKSEISNGSDDYWLVKINSSGQKVWDKTLGGNDTDVAESITSTSDGGFIIVGESSSGISGDKTEPHRGTNSSYYDYWIVKINSLGQKVWDKTYGGIEREYATNILPATDGGFIIAGQSRSGISVDKTEGNLGLEDFWILKIDNSGQKVWDKTIGSYGFDIPKSISSTSDGGYLIGGNSDSGIFADKTEASKGLNDFWIVKINSLGQKIWDKTIGGAQNEFLSTIQLLSDESYMLAGTSFSNISGDKSEASKGNSDYWVIKINNLGQNIWDKSFGGLGYEETCKMISISENEFFLGGSSDFGISGDISEINRGDNDYWVLKIVMQNQFFESITTGNWNVGSTWISPTNTQLPTATNSAKINSTHTVTIPNIGSEVKTIQMNGGILNLNGGTLEIKNQ